MKNIIVNILLKIVTSEFTKELIKRGLRKLVESTDNGIDDKLVEAIFNEVKASKKNDFDEIEAKSDISKKEKK